MYWRFLSLYCRVSRKFTIYGKSILNFNRKIDASVNEIRLTGQGAEFPNLGSSDNCSPETPFTIYNHFVLHVNPPKQSFGPTKCILVSGLTSSVVFAFSLALEYSALQSMSKKLYYYLPNIASTFLDQFKFKAT